MRARMDALGWGAVALGAAALVALVVLLRRLSRVAPDFSPPHAAPDDAAAAATTPADAPRQEP